MSEPFRCRECGFELPRPIVRLGVGTLGLYDDARFPGRCVLALNEHATRLEDLPPDAARALLLEARAAALAIREAAGARRMNYAAFGNVVPHVHLHLIPRQGPWETAPGASPWDHPSPERPLPPAEAERLVDALRAALSAHRAD